MINSRDIKELLPNVASMAEAFVKRCDEIGIDAIITSTYRDFESQQVIYNQGRVTPGKIVTWAKPGQSYHNFRCAFDFVPVVHGKAQWKDEALFAKCGEIAESVGLEWSGRWKRRKETAHCQYTGGLTLKDLNEGKLPQ